MFQRFGVLFALCLVLAVFLFAPVSFVAAATDSDPGVSVTFASPGGDEVHAPAAGLSAQYEMMSLITTGRYLLAAHGFIEKGGGKTIVAASEIIIFPTILMKTSAKTVAELNDEGGGILIARLSTGNHQVGALFAGSGGGKGSFLYADATIKDSYTAYAPRQSI
jgi:hypothetical protein